MALRPLVFCSGRFEIPWTPDVPLRVVSARLAAQLRPHFPNRVVSDGAAVRVRMADLLYVGAPVTGEVRLDHDATTLIARYRIGVERIGLLAFVCGLGLGALGWGLVTGRLDWTQALIPIVLVPLWLWSVRRGVREWIEPFETALRRAIPPS